MGKDIQEHFENALNKYNDNIKHLNAINEQDEVIKLLYQYKLDAISAFNKIFALNQDTFNNSSYLSWYNNSKRTLESEIATKENEVLRNNEAQSAVLCKELVEQGYKEVNQKKFYALF